MTDHSNDLARLDSAIPRAIAALYFGCTSAKIASTSASSPFTADNASWAAVSRFRVAIIRGSGAAATAARCAASATTTADCSRPAPQRAPPHRQQGRVGPCLLQSQPRRAALRSASFASVQLFGLRPLCPLIHFCDEARYRISAGVDHVRQGPLRNILRAQAWVSLLEAGLAAVRCDVGPIDTVTKR